MFLIVAELHNTRRNSDIFFDIVDSSVNMSRQLGSLSIFSRTQFFENNCSLDAIYLDFDRINTVKYVKMESARRFFFQLLLAIACYLVKGRSNGSY